MPAPRKPRPAASTRPCAPSAPWAARPRFITRAEGPYFWDADGKRYIDYIGSWGPAIVGHAHPEVVKAVQEAAARGLSFGAPTQGEVEMAEEICKLVPSIEQLRLVSSGTEATMSALRLARGATGRDKIVKFEGCYHGHADSLLVKAGSGLLTFGNPTSAGVPEDFVKHTLVLDYNDVAAAGGRLRQHGRQHRLRDRRTGGGQYEPDPRHARIPAGDARAVHEARRPADLR